MTNSPARRNVFAPTLDLALATTAMTMTITVTASSFMSSILHSAFGWTAVNYGVLPLVALTLGRRCG